MNECECLKARLNKIMRKSSLIDMLRYEAKRKPQINELVKNILSMTDQELETCVVPFPWYRKALKELRAITSANQIQVTISYTEDAMGEMKEWVGDDTFITLHGNSQIEIRNGKLLWFPVTGGYWFDTIFADKIDPIISKNVISRGMISHTGYKQKYTESLSGLVVEPEYDWSQGIKFY